MPQFIITTPDGKKYRVTGPNKDGALAALKAQLEGSQQSIPATNRFAKYAQQPQQTSEQPALSGNRFAKYKTGNQQTQGAGMFDDLIPAQNRPSAATTGMFDDLIPQRVAPGKTDRELSNSETAMDVAKSFGSGLGKGVISLVGGIGDVQRMTGGAAGWAASQFGASPQTRDMVSGLASRIAVPGFAARAPGSDTIQQGVESVTGPMYEPRSRAGRYAGTIGEFAPGALAGPGGMVRKTAMAAVPAIALEAAGELASGSPAEPYVRTAAAIAAGVPVAMAGRNRAMSQMRKTAPTLEEARTAKNADYQLLQKGGIKYDANGYQAFADDLVRRFSEDGFDPALNPAAKALADRIASLSGTSPGFTDIDAITKMAGNILRSGNSVSPADKAFAARTLADLDRWTGSAALISNGSIDPSQVRTIAKRAREMARRTIMAGQIDEMSRKADWYPSGGESGLRNQFASYGRSSGGKYLTDAEEAAYKRVIRREGPLGISHAAGSNLSTIGALSAGLVSAPFTGFTGPLVALGGVVGNRLARSGMEAYTMRAVRDARRTVLAGRDAQSRAIDATKAEHGKALGRSLLGMESATRPARDAFFVQDAKGNVYPYPAGLLGVPR